MFFGFRIMAAGSLGPIPLNWTIGDYGQQVTSSGAYNEALTAARGDQPALGFVEKFGQMFSQSLPEGIDPALLAQTMGEWKNFWIFPAIMAGVIFVVFAILFWDKAKAPEEGQATGEIAEAVEGATPQDPEV